MNSRIKTLVIGCPSLLAVGLLISHFLTTPLPTNLGFLNLPSYILGIVTATTGIWAIFMIATYKARKEANSTLESVLKHVGEHMSDAQQEAEQGNYGKASESVKQGLNEIEGMKRDMALTEIMEPNAEKEETES